MHVKVLIGAVAATVVLALAASAQPTPAAPAAETPAANVPASRCAAAPAEPRIPDGATVSDRGIVTANEAYVAWGTAVRAVAECRRAEFEEVNGQRRAKAAEHDQVNQQLKALSEQWVAQRTTYCARPRRQCRSIDAAELASQGAENLPCPTEVGAAPTIPDGATANQDAMDAADAAYIAYGRQAQRYMQCRHDEFDTLNAVAEARQQEYNRMVQRLNEVTASWEAERTIYCARPRKQCETTEQ